MKKKKKNKFLKKFLRFVYKKIKLLFISIFLFWIFYLFLCFFIYSIQEKMIFFPTNKIIEIENKKNLYNVVLTTDDNIKLDAVFLDMQSKDVVLFFHWNWLNLYHNQRYLDLFRKLWISALIFDYRSYGKSKWEIKNEIDLFRDADAAYTYLKIKRFYKDENIIFWWHSIWNSFSLNLAQNKKLKAVIVESAFYSLEEIAKKQYFYLPVSYILKYKFKNYEKIQAINSPIMIIHGENDEILPLKEAQKLYEVANFPKTFFKTEAYHNNWITDFFYYYYLEIKEFLKIN